MTIEELIERNERLAGRDRWLIPMLVVIGMGAGAALFASGMISYVLVSSVLSRCPAPTSTDFPHH